MKKIKNDDAMKKLNELLENISTSAPSSEAKNLKAPERKKKEARKPVKDDEMSDDEKAK